MKYFFQYILLVAQTFFIHLSFSNPLHINLKVDELSNKNNQSLKFYLNLPNNDTVEVGLSFRLLTVNESNYLKYGTAAAATTTATTQFPYTTTAEITTAEYDGNIESLHDVMQNDFERAFEESDSIDESTYKFITVEEAIESFRKDLIKKEIDIAGIIESKDKFYRHFKLEFEEDKFIKIRCTYDSNYAMRSLKISCYEYHEFESERILSNGEVEYFKQHDESFKSELRIIKSDNLQQTYHMNIQ